MIFFAYFLFECSNNFGNFEFRSILQSNLIQFGFHSNRPFSKEFRCSEDSSDLFPNSETL